MSMRLKNLLFTFLAAVVLVAILYVFSRGALRERFEAIERDVWLERASNVRVFVQDQYQALEKVALHGGVAGAQYAFVTGSAPQFAADFWNAAFFERQGVSFVCYTGQAGQLLFGRSYDVQSNRLVDLPEPLWAALRSSGGLERDVHRRGVLRVDDRVFLVVIVPVVQEGDEYSPAAGMLAVGSLLDQRRLLELNGRTGLFLELLEPAAIGKIGAPLPDYWIEPAGEDLMSTYVRLDGLDGSPVIVAHLLSFRQIYQQGLGSINYVLISMTVVGLALVLVYLFFFDRLVVQPVSRLTEAVRRSGSKPEEIAAYIASRSELLDLRQPLQQVFSQAQQIQAEGQQQRALYNALIEQAQEGFALIDAHSMQLLDANPAFERMFDLRSEWRNAALTEVFTSRIDVEWLKQMFAEVVGGRSLTFEQVVKLPDGQQIDLEINASLVTLVGQQVVYVLARNMSEQHRLQNELQRRLNETLLLNRVIAASSSVIEPKRIYTTICSELAQALSLPQAALAILKENEQILLVVAEYSSVSRPSALGYTFPIEPGTQSAYVVENRMPLAIEDVQNDPMTAAMREVARRRGIVSMLLVPLVVRDRVLGTLGLDSLEPRRFTPEEIDLAMNVASAVGQAVEIAQLYETLRQSQARLLLMLEQLPAILWMTDVQLQIISATGTALKGANLNGSSLYEFFQTQDDNYLPIQAHRRALRGETVSYEVEAMGGVFQASVEPFYDAQGRISGVLGIALEIGDRKRVETALRRDEEAMRSLYEIISSRQTLLSDKIQALLAMGCQHFHMGTAVLARFEGDRYEVVESYSHVGGGREAMIAALCDFSCGWMLQHNDLLALERIDEAGDSGEYQMGSCLGAPVVVEGVPYGVLSFSSAAARSFPFGANDCEFLRLMAQWAGTELEREQHLAQLRDFSNQIYIKNLDLAEARDQALEASRLKSEFLATMSHEIRTPLNAVIGMTELLLDTSLTTAQEEYTQVVHGAGQVLLALINDILDFSKIEAGKLSLENVLIEPRDVVQTVIEMSSGRAKEKGLDLSARVAADVPRFVNGDPIRLQQVLLNLVSNAIKFTSSGKIEVRLSVQPEAQEDGVMLRFEVEDSGIGLSEMARKRLFQPFTQADGSTTRKYGGTGLGLAICRRLVDLMGGEIGVESEEGCGSTFWFTVRFGRVDESETEWWPGADAGEDIPISLLGLPAEEQGQEEIQTEPLWILLAEDNPANQRLAVLQLQKLGQEVEAVDDGAQAVNAILKSQRPYAMILMDCQMPVLDGFDATRQIRTTEQISGDHIPVIAMTANATQADRQACLEAGMDDYISKPVTLESLRQIVERWGRVRRLPAAGGMKLSGAVAASLDPAIIQGIRELQIEGEPDILGELVGLYLRDSSVHLARMRQALDEDNRQVLRRSTHSLKGTSASMGARELARLCAQLEDLLQAESNIDVLADGMADIDAEYERVCQALHALVTPPL